MSDEIRGHSTYLAGQTYQITVRLETHVGLVQGYLKLSANFPARTLRNVQELNELLLRTGFETFGNIRHDGYASATDLVRQSVACSKSSGTGKRVDAIG